MSGHRSTSPAESGNEWHRVCIAATSNIDSFRSAVTSEMSPLRSCGEE
jgi:hypothetical protein